MKHMFQGVYIQILVTLVTDKVMAVSFMIAHKEVLAMGCLYVLPIGKTILNSEDCGMIVHLIGNPVVIQPGKRSLYFF